MMKQVKNILITGASMGIGREIAKKFTCPEHHLILVARSEDKLKELSEEIKKQGCSAEYFCCDLVQPEARMELISKIKFRYKHLNVLINNAGAGIYAKLTESSDEENRELFELNFFAIIDFIKNLSPLLKNQEKASIINISSIAAWRGFPAMSLYCASKFALNGLTESLRTELQNLGICMINIYPGVTDTQFSKNAVSYSWTPAKSKFFTDSAEKVAEKTWKAYQKGKREHFVNISNRILKWLQFFFPSGVDYAMRKIYKGGQ